MHLQLQLKENIIISNSDNQLSNFNFWSNAFKMDSFNVLSFSCFIRDLVIDICTSWINVVSHVGYSNMIEDIKIDLSTDFEHKITLDSLSKKYHLDKFKLLRSFKKVIGTTPNEYLLSMRIEHAKKMIHQGNSLLDAALDSGFYDQSHFHNYFKKKSKGFLYNFAKSPNSMASIFCSPLSIFERYDWGFFSFLLASTWVSPASRRAERSFSSKLALFCEYVFLITIVT